MDGRGSAARSQQPVLPPACTDPASGMLRAGCMLRALPARDRRPRGAASPAGGGAAGDAVHAELRPACPARAQPACSGRRTRRPGSRCARRCRRRSPRCCTWTVAWRTPAPPRSWRPLPRRSSTTRWVRQPRRTRSAAARSLLVMRREGDMPCACVLCNKLALWSRDLACWSATGMQQQTWSIVATPDTSRQDPHFQSGGRPRHRQSRPNSAARRRQQPGRRVVRGGLRAAEVRHCAAPPLRDGLPAGLPAHGHLPRRLHQQLVPERPFHEPVPGAPARAGGA